MFSHSPRRRHRQVIGAQSRLRTFRCMTKTLIDRLGLGNDRAVANARQALVDRQREDRLIAELIRAIQVHEVLAASPDRSRRIAA